MEVYNDYVPLPWQAKAHAEEWMHGCFVGGKGGAKTRFCIEEMKALLWEYPGITALVGRKTLPSLKDTTWRELMEVLPQELIKDYNKTERVVTLVNDSRILGRSLDDPKKFESLKIASFFLDEADELEQETYDTLKTRLREMPRKNGIIMMPRYRSMLALNPTEEDHWIPRLFLNNPPKDHKLFFSSTLDNAANLPPGYVAQLKATYSEDMQQRMIYGMFGKVHKGRPVFPQFRKGEYIQPIAHDPKATIFRSWDFGFRRPGVVWVQFIDGQMRVLAEMMGENIYLDNFVREKVLPYQRELFGIHPVFRDFCDPHGSDESDKGKTSVEILNDFGIYPVYRKTFIEEGIKAIKELLDTKNQRGEPNFLIHGRCRVLIEGARGGYHRLDGENNPEKDGYYDHLFDCLRYVSIHLLKRHKFNRGASFFQNQQVYVNPRTGRRVEI